MSFRKELNTTIRHTLKACFSLKGFLIFLTVATLSSCSVSARIKKADKKYEIGEYYEAGDMYRSTFYRISYKERKLRAKVAFNQGECYRKINYYRAPAAYQNAIRNKYADSIVYLRYAQTLQYAGKYSDAAKQYTIYLENQPEHKVALDGLRACKEATAWRKLPSRYKVGMVKEFEERRVSTFAPAYIGESGTSLVFTSTRKGGGKPKKSSITGIEGNKLFTTRKNATGKWEEVEVLAGVNSESENVDQGVASFTSDGRTMYFTRGQAISGQDKGAEICVSERAGGEWSEPQAIKLFKDSTITVGHPAISADGEVLYFVSDAPGGQGGKDIWKATKGSEGWENITNLGADINTMNDEMYPTLRFDSILYFSSTGHAGFGGLDLFKATPTGETSWLVENMGVPFNSQNDDFGITFEGDAEAGFFSSNRNDKRGYDRLYSFILPQLVLQIEGQVTTIDGDTLSSANIRLVGNDGTNARIQTKKDGTYRLKLNKNVSYVMLGSSRGYLNQKQELKIADIDQSKTYKQNFVLSPISKPVTMSNVFYEFGKWNITPDSEKSLQELVKLLNDNMNITIELSAHTDKVGDATANKTLSEKRAQAVVDFLIQSGIDKERLTPVGYGKEKPVVVDKNMNKQYPYLPLEQELNEAFIDTLPADQQEVANQINRRTEFKVLKTTYNLF